MLDKNNMMKFMEQAQEIQNKMKNIQKEISNMQSKGESGAGLVQITINGNNNCIKTQIDPSLLNIKKKEILEDLITAAFNSALQKINEEKKNKMYQFTPESNFSNTINPFI